MKLESLNNKKFKLNTKEMGSLVGGEQVKEATEAGTKTEKLPWGTVTTTWSADCKTTNTDSHGNVTTSTDLFTGDDSKCIKDPCACS